MDAFWVLVIVQALAALLQRWVGTALFIMGSEPQFWNLPSILYSNPAVTKAAVALPTVAAIAVVICGFVFTDHPWWLLIVAVVSMAWASPPYRRAQ